MFIWTWRWLNDARPLHPWSTLFITSRGSPVSYFSDIYLILLWPKKDIEILTLLPFYLQFYGKKEPRWFKANSDAGNHNFPPSSFVPFTRVHWSRIRRVPERAWRPWLRLQSRKYHWWLDTYGFLGGQWLPTTFTPSAHQQRSLLRIIFNLQTSSPNIRR